MTAEIDSTNISDRFQDLDVGLLQHITDLLIFCVNFWFVFALYANGRLSTIKLLLFR